MSKTLAKAQQEEKYIDDFDLEISQISENQWFNEPDPKQIPLPEFFYFEDSLHQFVQEQNLSSSNQLEQNSSTITKIGLESSYPRAQRKKSQNTIKTIHYKCIKILEELNLKNYITDYISKVHRKDFLIICLMAVDCSNKFENFERIFSEEIEKMKVNANGDLLEDIRISFEAIEIYKEVGYKKACEKMFSEKQKNSKTFYKSISFMKETEKKLKNLINQNQISL